MSPRNEVWHNEYLHLFLAITFLIGASILTSFTISAYQEIDGTRCDGQVRNILYVYIFVIGAVDVILSILVLICVFRCAKSLYAQIYASAVEAVKRDLEEKGLSAEIN